MLNDDNVSKSTQNQQSSRSNLNFNVSQTRSAQPSSQPLLLPGLHSYNNPNYIPPTSNINNIASSSNININVDQRSLQLKPRKTKKRIQLVDSDEDDIDLQSKK